ncbi:hypothetical protein [Acidiferrobacter sp.]|uniref:hypothetical protein n=1 Tax=Acidiferrobacter sp. TaxID=1872107 RepID=UPI002624F602|nr:hypothetical protein [Acidiferrobacter sp.]
MSDRLNGYVTFPYAAQVACVEREIFPVRKHKTTLEWVYLITSQHRTEAGPARLLAQNRGHWAIENRLHHVRDMAYDEDRCRARVGHAPGPSPACGSSPPACCICSTLRTSKQRSGAWLLRPTRS